MKLTFKNVGQGDSVILEHDGKITIIDCNLDDSKTNPVLEHLILHDYKKIDALVVSHPHTDHLSGFPQLLRHCLASDIPIRFILHTCMVVPEYLNSGKSLEGIDLVVETFELFAECVKKFGSVLGTMTPDMCDTINLGEGYQLKLIAPTSVHIGNYRLKVDYQVDYEEMKGNSAAANWLSTVFQIVWNDSYILLTADAPVAVLKYLSFSAYKKHFQNKTLVLAQSPHHGAKSNHSRAVWKTLRAGNTDIIPVVMSVGKNIYKHPSVEVVKCFLDNNFDVHSTNFVGGLSKTISADVEMGMSTLDLFSTVKHDAPKSKYYGDQSFYFKDGIIKRA